METTVIGVFEDRAKAQNAMDALLNVGFGRDDVQLRSPEDLPAATAPGLDDASAGGTIGGTFGMQTGIDHPDADSYLAALRRGGCLLMVKSRNDEQHVEITNILDRFGPVDIDDRA